MGESLHRWGRSTGIFSPGYILALDVKQRVGIEAFTSNPVLNSTREKWHFGPGMGDNLG